MPHRAFNPLERYFSGTDETGKLLPFVHQNMPSGYLQGIYFYFVESGTKWVLTSRNAQLPPTLLRKTDKGSSG